METRANYALIGLFTLAVLAAGFFFVFWFSGKDAGAKIVSYRIIFTGSVSGLSRGANVLYNGLKVGEVSSLSFATNDPNRVVARVDIDATTPMNVDTRARLEYSGLTGVAAVQLSGGKPGSQPLEIKDPSKPPIIYADRSDFQDLLETAQRLARKADDVLTRADQLFADNEGSISKTVRNIEQFTDALAQNSGGVGKFLSSAGGAADEIKTLSQKLQTLSDSAEKILNGVNPGDIAAIIGDLKQVTDTVAQDRAKITAILDDASQLANRLNQSSTKLDSVLTSADNALKGIDGVVKGVDGSKVARTLDNIDRFTGTLADNTQRVDEVLKNVGELSGKLNKASDRFDGVLANADSALKSIDNAVKGVDGAKIARTVDNIDRFSGVLAQNSGRVDEVLKNVDEISGKLNKASDRIDSVLADASGALKGIDATMKGIDPAKVARTIDNIDKVAQAIGGNAGDIQATLQNARELTAKLNRSADQVDDVLKSAQRFLGSGEGQGALNDVAEAAKSIRRLADNLDKRTAEITAGVNRLTGPGVRDFEAFATEGRKTLGEINRTLRSFQSNPQQLIFGQKSNIPEYQGRP
ncbi:MAG: MlaD family protein [Alsobacter sp.]